MGCLQSKEKDGDIGGGFKEEAPKKIDSRLPFENYRQLFNLKNSWKTVSRSMEAVAKDNLSRQAKFNYFFKVSSIVSFIGHSVLICGKKLI